MDKISKEGEIMCQQQLSDAEWIRKRNKDHRIVFFVLMIPIELLAIAATITQYFMGLSIGPEEAMAITLPIICYGVLEFFIYTGKRALKKEIKA